MQELTSLSDDDLCKLYHELEKKESLSNSLQHGLKIL